MSRVAHPRSRRRKPDGYILLTVVVMIAVASIMLASLASKSLRLASTAVTEERKLRQRWATASLRRYGLDAAEPLLASAARDSGSAEEPFVSVWKDIELCGQEWRVIISDESAKLNLVSFANEFDAERTSSVFKELRTGRQQLDVSSALSVSEIRQIQRWEKWFAPRSADRSSAHFGGASEGARQIAAATQQVTLWGDGKLNVAKCSETTIDTLWRELFGRRAPQELHAIRGQSPPPSTAAMIDSLALRESQSDKARNWLTTESSCFSVWIFCLSDHGGADSMFVEWGSTSSTRERRGYLY